MWGETCHWAAILSDPALDSMVYIAVKIPWIQRLLQYRKGTTLHKAISIVLYVTQFCNRRHIHYPLYGPWPMCHFMCWLLSCLLCCASRQVAGDLG